METPPNVPRLYFFIILFLPLVCYVLFSNGNSVQKLWIEYKVTKCTHGSYVICLIKPLSKKVAIMENANHFGGSMHEVPFILLNFRLAVCKGITNWGITCQEDVFSTDI